MGCRFAFQCPDCGYKAEVSGAADCGFVAATTTIVCHDCRELLDIVTGYHQKAGKKPPPFRCPQREAAANQGVDGRKYRLDEPSRRRPDFEDRVSGAALIEMMHQSEPLGIYATAEVHNELARPC
jgi:hypothetical protein